MATKTKLELQANSTIRYLNTQGLLTKEHDLTVQLIRELASEWSMATSSTQRAAISKELRYAIGMLPTAPVTEDDAEADFLASLAEDD